MDAKNSNDDVTAMVSSEDNGIVISIKNTSKYIGPNAEGSFLFSNTCDPNCG